MSGASLEADRPRASDPVGWARLALRLVALAATLAAMLPLHGAWRLFRRPSPWPRRFLAAAARIVGAAVAVRGRPLARDVLFVANHLSWLDIPILAGATGCAFVSKAELADLVLVGLLARLNRTVFVARGDRLGVAAQVEQLRAALGTRPLAIFPEGTTGDGVMLRPFKPALLAAASPPPPRLSVQPVRIDYGEATAELAWVGGEPGARHAARVLRRRGRVPVTLAFGEPFDPAALPDRKAVAAEARRRIEGMAGPSASTGPAAGGIGAP